MHVWHMRRNRVSDGAIHRAFPRRRRLLLPRHYMCHMRTIHVSYEEEDAFVIRGYMRLSEHLVCVPTVPLSAHKKGGGWREFIGPLLSADGCA